MADVPLHESSAHLLDGPVRDLPDRVAGGVAATLAARLGLRPADVDRSALVTAAIAEAERLSDVVVRPEHLVLAWALVTGVPPAPAREALQVVVAEHAHADYENLTPCPAAKPPLVVLVAGVPGTGKSTLAEGLARRLRAPVFSVDWHLGALVPFGVLREDNAVPLAELTLTAATARQVRLGLDVIVDATAHRAETRARWRSLAAKLGGVFVGVKCVCSDERAQRERVEGRSRGIPGWHPTVSWEHVQRMRALWEPWDEPHLVIDSAVVPQAAAVKEVLAHLGFTAG
ncbi:AAA family ATPase [Actinosynnema sp. NPDC023587]|uniref:AAA family ATPase n=1 Tax=Actinosynnema sp. NPDC023587 TaxID=3154695 RepID=UPI0033E9E56A